MEAKVLKGEDDKGLSLISELAYLCCDAAREKVSAWIDDQERKQEALRKKREKLKLNLIVSGGALFIGVCMLPTSHNGIGSLMALVAAGAGILFITKKSKLGKEAESLARSAPDFKLEGFTAMSWEGDVIETGDGALIVDRAQLFPNHSLQFNSLVQGWEKSKEVLGGLQERLSQPPVVSPYSYSADKGNMVTGDYEVDLIEELAGAQSVLRDIEQLQVSVSLVSPASDLGKSIGNGIVGGWFAADAGNLSGETKILGNLYIQSSQQGDMSDEKHEGELIALEQSCSRNIGRISDMRRESIVEHLNSIQRSFDEWFFLPMVRLSCPECHKKAVGEQEAGVQLNVSEVMADLRGEDKGQLVNKNRLFKVSTLKFRHTSRSYCCEQCGECFTLGDLRERDVLGVMRVKEELVYPLWDRLWDELSTERYRILREKEQQLMENKTKEHDELNRTQAEFADERRSIRERLDDIIEVCTRTEESIDGLLEALETMQLLDRADAAHYRSVIGGDRQAITSGIEEMRSWMKKLEAQMEGMAGESFDQRNTLVDEVDEVKRRGQFLHLNR